MTTRSKPHNERLSDPERAKIASTRAIARVAVGTGWGRDSIEARRRIIAQEMLAELRAVREAFWRHRKKDQDRSEELLQAEGEVPVETHCEGPAAEKVTTE